MYFKDNFLGINLFLSATLFLVNLFLKIYLFLYIYDSSEYFNKSSYYIFIIFLFFSGFAVVFLMVFYMVTLFFSFSKSDSRALQFFFFKFLRHPTTKG